MKVMLYLEQFKHKKSSSEDSGCEIPDDNLDGERDVCKKLILIWNNVRNK